MTGLANNRLEVALTQDDGIDSDIGLAIGFQAADGTWRRDVARITNTWCPFGHLHAWIGSLIRGVPRPLPRGRKAPCWTGFDGNFRGRGMLLGWDDEGGDVWLVYLRGRLLYRNRGHQGWWRLRIPAREVAMAFYRALRHFVDTGYDRCRYEQLTCLREVLACQLERGTTQTTALIALSRLPLAQAVAALDQQVRDYLGGPSMSRTRTAEAPSLTTTQRWISDRLAGWPSARRRTRLRLLRRLLATRFFAYGSRTRLEHLRHRVLERWLAEGAG